MRLLIVDNYDSFTFNLVHYVESILDATVEVYFNDAINLSDVNCYDKIILSPGPGLPEESGILVPLIKQYAASKSILGVCLGHQAIAVAFGGSLFNLDEVYHGVSMNMNIEANTTKKQNSIFQNIPSAIEVGRYHSWMVDEQSLPENFEVTARDENGWIMAMQHKHFDVQGVQFHPESVLTNYGKQMLANWLQQ